MDPRIRLISAAAAVLIVCRAADRSEATVVRDGPGATGNPAVQTGGHRVRDNPASIIQFTIIGGWNSQSPWFSPCSIWPWSAFNPFWQSRARPILILPIAPRVP
jgi:hypothetical protein